MSLDSQNLFYKLKIIFAFFFLTPLIAFLYFNFKYGLIQDKFTPLIAIGLLCSSFFGYTLLRRLFDEIINISNTISKTGTADEQNKDILRSRATELGHIVDSFSTIERQLKQTNIQLEKRASEVSVLKELSDLCYVTFDPHEILYVTLERALVLTRSNVGSIMEIEESIGKYFVVTASIGHGENVKIGDRFDFDKSIAKYAVINKSPLVVEDIERQLPDFISLLQKQNITLKNFEYRRTTLNDLFLSLTGRKLDE